MYIFGIIATTIQGDQKVSVNRMITILKVTSNVQRERQRERERESSPPVSSHLLTRRTVLSKIVFSIAQIVFSIAQTVFSIAQTVFSIAQIVFSIAQTVFSIAQTVFSIARSTYRMYCDGHLQIINCVGTIRIQ
jgi:hypothetical protein